MSDRKSFFFLQGRPLLRANMATERHAGKIYTRAMFEQFGHIVYECGAYQVEEIEKGKHMLQFIQKQNVGRSGAGFRTK